MPNNRSSEYMKQKMMDLLKCKTQKKKSHNHTQVYEQYTLLPGVSTELLLSTEVCMLVPAVKPFSNSSCLFRYSTPPGTLLGHHPYAGSLLLGQKVCQFACWYQRNSSQVP